MTAGSDGPLVHSGLGASDASDTIASTMGMVSCGG